MFALGGMNVYISGTPYPGKATEYVKHMTKVATDLPVVGMVMTPSWGYLSPGNKDKYARQAKYVASQMKKAALANSLQIGFSNLSKFYICSFATCIIVSPFAEKTCVVKVLNVSHSPHFCWKVFHQFTIL